MEERDNTTPGEESSDNRGDSDSELGGGGETGVDEYLGDADDGSAVEIEFVDDDEGSNEGRDVNGDIDQRLRTAEQELERFRELYLRKLAEFDNFRRRVEREKDESGDVGAASLVESLVPVLDNFDRALAHTDSEIGSFREGVEMIAGQLRDTLAREGLEVIDPGGAVFDPEIHDAVNRVESTDRPPGTVAEVIAKGYVFRRRLVRPAIVVVAVSPEVEGDEGRREREHDSSDGGTS